MISIVKCKFRSWADCQKSLFQDGFCKEHFDQKCEHPGCKNPAIVLCGGGTSVMCGFAECEQHPCDRH